MARRVILWRHGQTDFNVDRRIQGASDVPLNEVGKRQACEAAQWLAQLKPHAIVASPLMRAHVTATALGECTGLDVVLESRVTERCFGVWEGMSGKEIESSYPQQYQAWRAGEDPVGVGVETRADVGRRVREAVEEWAGKDDGTLVVVSHGAAIKCGITAMLGEDPGSWAGISVMGNCHWAVVEPAKERDKSGEFDGGSWRIVTYNAGDGVVGM